MRKFKYESPRLHSGELRTPVIFFEYEPNDGPIPGEEEKRTLYKTWAKVDEMWLKDKEIAHQNGTMTDLTLIIRDPMTDYIPTDEHYVSVDDLHYKGKKYHIKHVQPDVQDRAFINVIAELHE